MRTYNFGKAFIPEVGADVSTDFVADPNTLAVELVPNVEAVPLPNILDPVPKGDGAAVEAGVPKGEDGTVELVVTAAPKFMGAAEFVREPKGEGAALALVVGRPKVDVENVELFNLLSAFVPNAIILLSGSPANVDEFMVTLLSVNEFPK